jgi:DNA-binding LytR/AlgR family response regulator
MTHSSILRLATQSKHRLPFDLDKVVSLEGSINYTLFWLNDGTRYLSSKTIGQYEHILPSNFIRVHKQHIVNSNYLEQINIVSKSIILQNTQELHFSRRRWRWFLSSSYISFVSKNTFLNTVKIRSEIREIYG